MPEEDPRDNKGLAWGMEQIEKIKQDGNSVTEALSYSDLIQLGGYAAIEYCGGPSMRFRSGREDHLTESDEMNTSRMPDDNDRKAMIYAKMIRAGFTKQEFVAILGSDKLS
jgi:cytochrome c peroxidase